MKLRIASTFLCLLIGSVAAAPLAATQWHATVGGQSYDMGRQVAAFLPNEIWIHAGDSIVWTFDANDIHTMTLLVSGEVRPPFPVGCPPGPPPGITPSGSSFDGTHCINSGPQVAAQQYTVRFPVAGNFKLTCLVHTDMTGVIHVLPPSMPLPHDQAFYNREAADTRQDMLADRDFDFDPPHPFAHEVVAGRGEVTATPGGHNSLAVVRFTNHVMYIHRGQTVEWSNADPGLPHTVTFGREPANPLPPSANVTVDADGALHATIHSQSDRVNSGLLVAEPQDNTGLPQSPPGVTRFRVTFTKAGIYPYICALHDNLGMRGQIIVSN
jgi:plastocyanin